MQTLDYAGLVDIEHGLIDRRIFSDPEIYQRELERIFGRCWLYLCHESQLQNPGDFVTTWARTRLSSAGAPTDGFAPS